MKKICLSLFAITTLLLGGCFNDKNEARYSIDYEITEESTDEEIIIETEKAKKNIKNAREEFMAIVSSKKSRRRRVGEEEKFESTIENTGKIIEGDLGQDYIIEGNSDELVIEEKDAGIEIEIKEGKIIIKEQPITILSTNGDVDLLTAIEMAAYQSDAIGDEEEFNSLLIDTGLKNDYDRIMKDYNVVRSAKTLNTRTRRSYDVSIFENPDFRTGDIFLRASKTPLGKIIVGDYKHGGLFDKERQFKKDCIYSAGSDAVATNRSGGTGAARVGYESKASWIELAPNKIGIFRVNNTNETQGENALKHVLPQMGKGFGFYHKESRFHWKKIKVRKGWVRFTITIPAYKLVIVPTSRTSTDEYYCTKIVWQGWKSQGKDVEGTNWTGVKGPWVMPDDIERDNDIIRIYGN